MSVIIYFAIAIVSSVISSAFSRAMDGADLTGTLNSHSHYSAAVSTLNTILLVWIIFMVVVTGILVAVTNLIFHKHLNLE